MNLQIFSIFTEFKFSSHSGRWILGSFAILQFTVNSVELLVHILPLPKQFSNLHSPIRPEHLEHLVFINTLSDLFISACSYYCNTCE